MPTSRVAAPPPCPARPPRTSARARPPQALDQDRQDAVEGRRREVVDQLLLAAGRRRSRPRARRLEDRDAPNAAERIPATVAPAPDVFGSREHTGAREPSRQQRRDGREQLPGRRVDAYECSDLDWVSSLIASSISYFPEIRRYAWDTPESAASSSRPLRPVARVAARKVVVVGSTRVTKHHREARWPSSASTREDVRRPGSGCRLRARTTTKLPPARPLRSSSRDRRYPTCLSAWDAFRTARRSPRQYAIRSVAERRRRTHARRRGATRA